MAKNKVVAAQMIKVIQAHKPRLHVNQVTWTWFTFYNDTNAPIG